jgi:dipeptidyl aminopeptidase/acylaminoacyl peptidase
VEEHTFTGAGGDTVQLWMIYPPDFDASKKYPLVQLMHGGPATMVGDIWQHRWNAQVFVTPGYVATWINRHGSTGFGEKFVASIDGGWGDKPYEDIMKGTDWALAKFPFLDASRTAAMGASYGGYMATWICGHTNRFKTIVCHAGVTDFDTQYASDVALYWQDGPMAGSPWQRTKTYDAQNPMTYAANFKTPTLVIHGELDYRVPVAQGITFYAALQAQGVPSRFVYFPDENHWILKPQNSVFWYGEIRDWLARWIGDKANGSKPAE